MITVCPTCALTLAVTAADLRVGQGQVRCGRCAAVFNALAALQDDLSETSEHPRPPDLAQTPEEFDPSQTDVNEVARGSSQESALVEPAATFSFEEPAQQIEATAPAVPASANDDDAYTPPSANDDTMAPVAANDEIHVESVVVQEDDPRPDLDLDLTPAAPPAVRHYWLAGSALLVALLGIQAVHYNRNNLAARDNWRGPLQALYASIGVELQPVWQPSAFVVQRRGEMMADDQGAMTLRASLQNSAANSQPLPLLRVVLLDRFGARIAARDLQPQEYLPARVAAEMRYLAAGQRVDAEVALADPGAAAAGFELDACLKVSPERLQCANHTAVRR
jgi:predicted Zn finger-like uncharacterized protein